MRQKTERKFQNFTLKILKNIEITTSTVHWERLVEAFSLLSDPGPC